MTIPSKVRCEIILIKDHGQHVYTIELKPERTIPKFLPGQFLHLAINDYDPSGFWPDSRPFSIASNPAHRDHISITYSVVGSFTSRMEQELTIGKFVWIKLPYGDFFVNSDKNIVLFAGGTGITAFISYIENLSITENNSIRLFYGAKSWELLIYRQLTERVAKNIPQFKVIYFSEKQRENEVLGNNERIGLLTLNSTTPYIDGLDNKEFYLSGPPGMLTSLKSDLLSCNISAEKIHVDSWF